MSQSPGDSSSSALTERFPIVGLGASAGGLEAFEQFLRHMPAQSGMAFVLVQHLDPSHPSILTEILQRSTAMPVVEAEEQMAVLPNHVYVIPPNRDMVIFHGALHLNLPAEPRGRRMPIDAFLRSLAEDRGEDAAAIVLSGTGTDGTLGLRAVLGAGGLCLVQDPATARHDGMPMSAINAGYATRVMPVDRMPQALRDGTRALPIRQAAALPSPSPTARGLSKILMLLRTGTGNDFSQYKKSTIGRRIERRMAQHGIEDAEVYARYLKEHPAELQTLFRELLINVTSFFRDPLAFAELKRLLPGMLSDKPEDYVLRVWVAGCATGEEAYSIAILLREVMDETHRDFKVQMYGTDLDEDAITAARAGLYPPNIAQDVSPDRLRRFFVKEDAGYQVKKEIREMVVFAVQNVMKDPPFTRLDLLACRNLMIYLEPELQNRVIPVFHYALKPGGVLFLSPSESIGSQTDLFDPIDRKWKLYRGKPIPGSARPVVGTRPSWSTGGKTSAPRDATRRAKEPDLAGLATRMLLQAFTPAAVVTDPQGNILYVHGETGRFLRPAPGHPTHNVFDMAREGLEVELRDALRQAQSNGLVPLSRELRFETDGETQMVRLGVRRLPDEDESLGLLLVSFEPLPVEAPPQTGRKRRGAPADARRLEAAERELALAKGSLKAMLTDQQASNEELKSTNEELQSTNEELQSTNEEMETSKEELQSVNEELMTVNTELQTKIEQMANMRDDMKNLLDNIRIGTIFLDRHLVIRRFTRDATRVYRLVGNDVGRPLADIRSDVGDTDLLADAQAVLDSLVPIEREVRTAGGTWYLASIRPYRTVDDIIDGVVLTFADVTERVRAIAGRKALALAEAIVDTVRDPLVVLDGGLQVMSANRSFYREFGGTPDSTVARRFFELADGQWDFPQAHDLLETVLPRELSFERRVVQHEFPILGMRSLRFSARRIVDRTGIDELVLLTVETRAADEDRPS